MKVLPIDPVFSNWVNFNIKVFITNGFTNSKNFKAIYFFFEIQKLKIFEIKSFFFQFSCVHYFFQLYEFISMCCIRFIGD